MIARLIVYLFFDGLFFLTGVALIAEYGRAIFPALAVAGVGLLIGQMIITIVARLRDDTI